MISSFFTTGFAVLVAVTAVLMSAVLVRPQHADQQRICSESRLTGVTQRPEKE
jgi:hypothetical protein